VGDKLSAGYAVVKAQGTGFVVEKVEVVPQPASAQFAELVGLTEVCLLAEGCSVSCQVFKSRGHKQVGTFGSISSDNAREFVDKTVKLILQKL